MKSQDDITLFLKETQAAVNEILSISSCVADFTAKEQDAINDKLYADINNRIADCYRLCFFFLVGMMLCGIIYMTCALSYYSKASVLLILYGYSALFFSMSREVLRPQILMFPTVLTSRKITLEAKDVYVLKKALLLEKIRIQDELTKARDNLAASFNVHISLAMYCILGAAIIYTFLILANS